ncbi:MAG: tetratricopeptide repeat protein, partial [Pseudomonadota bacterium]|nr:tetratricopeptide repeat protein [Pseudomonadota bacterium]
MSPPRGACEQVSLDLLVAERWQEAQARAAKDLQTQPGNPWLQHNLAVACWKLGDLARARSHFDAALRAAPGFPEALANLSVMLSETGFDPAALAICEQAAAAYPDVMHLHSNLGMARLFAGQLDAAEAAFDHALALEPGAPTPRYNRSFVRLLRGELASGFADYEARFDGSGLWPDGRPSYGLPVWSGQPLRGRRLMIHAEQGFGDTLQFIRYLPMLAAQGPAHLEVHVQPQLLPALAALGRHAELRALGSLASPCEFGLPLLSLPHVLGTTQDSVPGLLRYLHADPERVALWRERLGTARGPRVALVWQGSTTHVRDSERSLDLATLAALDIAGIEWLSLQKGAAAQAASSGPWRLRAIGDDLHDFADTAAVLSLVDLVICVDTSVAHLAGALGVPAAVLLSWIPDPRWLLERSDSPWYPSTTLYRQAHRGDWSAPVAALAARLAALCQDHADRQARAGQWDAQGVNELAAGRADAALAPLMQALADCPTHAGAHYHLGRALRALGRTLEAECCYRQALALQPDLDEAATSLALLLREAGEHAPSVALLTAVSARQPGSASALAMLGNGQLLAGDPSLAIESYQGALTRDSQHAAATAGLRRALQQVGLPIPWVPADAEGLCRLAEQLLDR